MRYHASSGAGNGATVSLSNRTMNDRAAPPSVEPPEGESPEQEARPVDVVRFSGVPDFVLTGLFVLAIFYTLYFTRDVLLPIVLAILLTLVLTPAMRLLVRLRVPRPLGAALVVAALLGLLGFGVNLLFDPAAQWLAKAPDTFRDIERKLRNFKRSVERVSKAAEKVEEIAKVDPAGKAPAVTVATEPTLMRRILAGTQHALIAAASTIVLLYFLLAAGDMFLRKLVKVMPTFANKKKAVGVARTVQDEMGSYLFTITCINTGLGIATGVAMWLLGMPNPALWGVMAAVFNFVPYLGALTSLIVLSFVAVITFDGVAQALAVPATFFALTVVEGQILTPIITGRRLTLNPVVIFLAMLFWGWLWGMIGALIAVPIVMTFKIICDHVESLAPLGEFLSGQRTETLEE